jgi:hypothetical protein
MENKSEVENKTVSETTVPEKIVRAPGQAETVMVEGEKGKVVEAGSLVADTTKTDTTTTETTKTDTTKTGTPDSVKNSHRPTDAPVSGNKSGVTDMTSSSKQYGKDSRQGSPNPSSPPTTPKVEPSVATVPSKST